MIIRATQRLMMSRAVDRTLPGYQRAQLGRVLGPAERRVGPERRREPRVEHVVGLLPALALGPLDLHDVGAVGREPDRQPVAPPELARDAPGPDALHPVEVDLLAALRVERHAPVADDLDGRPRELVHAAEPLQRHERLDAPARSGCSARRSGGSGSSLAQRARLAQLRHRALVRLAAVRRGQPLPVRPQVEQPAVEADGGQRRQAVAAADLEVDRVVAGRDLQRARAEVHLDLGVGDDRHRAGRPAARWRACRSRSR